MSQEENQPKQPPSLYDQGNDALRMDNFGELDDSVMVAMRSFFRQLGAPHLFEERVLPTLKVPGSAIFAAVRDRPWPPWGHGARRICAMIQIHPISDQSYGLSPMYVRSEDVSNLGMRAALYKEALESLRQHTKAEINYLVIEGAVLTDRILRSLGFARGKDLLVTEEARYFFYRADVQSLLEKLQLNNVSTPELLSHQIKDSVLTQNALFQGVLDWARYREVIPIDGGSFAASLPGGVPPSPPSRIDIGPIGSVDVQRQ